MLWQSATIIGPKASLSRQFLVDTGSTYVMIPEKEFSYLGLTISGQVSVLTAEGVANRAWGWANVVFNGQTVRSQVIASPIPIRVIGYDVVKRTGLTIGAPNINQVRT